MSTFERPLGAALAPQSGGVRGDGPSGPFAGVGAARGPLAEGWLAKLDAWLTPWGERLNPILVKEARQALKSRRFLSTFSLVLVFAIGWSFLGVAWMGDSIHFGASGPMMFFGYYCVLAFPLLVVVPFGAFQSLAAERHDGTYDLLSITTLKPRQLVTGKLASALLEMLVYLSAVAPCLGFTYLLPGIDFLTILLVLLYTCHCSLGLSLIGLLLATVTNERHWQMVLSVLLVMGLLGAFFGLLSFVAMLVDEGPFPWHEAQLLLGNLILLTMFWGGFALAFAATAAQLTFTADNRSTALRVVMAVNQAIFLGWMGYVWIITPEAVIFVFLLLVGYGYWAALGLFLVAEGPEMSHRVRRSLPQTLLARAFSTWFAPGPGTGYMFVLANLLALDLATLAGYIATYYSRGGIGRWGSIGWDTVVNVACLGFLYIAIYLGIGRLLLAAARRHFAVPLSVGVLVQMVVLILACVLPLIFFLFSQQPYGYSVSQIANPFWTIAAAMDDDIQPNDRVRLYRTLIAAAVVVFMLNMPRVAYEVSRVQVAKPRRVLEEEAAESSQPLVQAAPSSPWEEGQQSEENGEQRGETRG